ncbi:C45 family autoproteolytic acyltransferase/hydolase [Pseudonocardia humida]|uniref:Peptidase C45 n=1 Tax=Pseudonocardia humida TaxID=2800819 RepID=A0ABT0ZX78_9PSEU|nr:C45 family peptidase [Pseudonocardia humida]MCO1655280.1 peptidase C45 [Pseudonocardia humida]
MTLATHVSTATDPRARGRELGEAHRDAVRATAATYLELFAAHGADEARVRGWAERALDATAGWAPAAAAEIEGIAAGSGLPLWRVAALTARTEILAAADVTGHGECSTAVVLPGDGTAPRTVQTWDWHDVLRGAMLGRTLRPAPGRWVCTFTEAGVIGKIGVSSAGLGLHFNALKHASDTPDIGVPVHVVARRILDEADTVADAVALARSARLSASTVVTVVTRGEARCLELSPAGVGEVAPDATGFLAHTNHFLDPRLVDGERADADSTTWRRLAWLRAHRDALAAPDPTARARALHAHAADGAAVCAHPDLALAPHERWESLATVAIDVVDRSLHVAVGGPCTVGPDSWQVLRAAAPVPVHRPTATGQRSRGRNRPVRAR